MGIHSYYLGSIPALILFTLVTVGCLPNKTEFAPEDIQLYDNAKIESFFRTLKVEEIYMFEYETYA